MKSSYISIKAGNSAWFHKSRITWKTRRMEYIIASDSRDPVCVVGIASLLEFEELPTNWQLT